MFTLMLGVLIVAGSAFVFGLALFGPRPVPQPAMPVGTGPITAPPPVPAPSSDGAGAADAPVDDEPIRGGRLRRMLQREPTADHQPGSDVTLSTWVRVRSGLWLAIIVAGLATIVGGVLSVVVVGVVLLVT